MYNVHPCPKYLTFSVFFNDLDILHARKIFRNILTVFFINDFDILHAWKTFRTMYIWVCSHMFLSLCTVGFSQKVGYVLLNKGICKRFFGIFPTRSYWWRKCTVAVYVRLCDFCPLISVRKASDNITRKRKQGEVLDREEISDLKKKCQLIRHMPKVEF